MALEFEIKTDQAARAIDVANTSIDALAASLDNAVQKGAAVDDLTAKLEGVKPVDSAVPTSLEKTAEAADKVGEAAPKVKDMTDAVEKLGEGSSGAATAAENVDKLAQSTEKLDPAKPNEFADAMSKINAASAGSGAAFGGFSQAMEDAARASSGYGNALLDAATHGGTFAEATSIAKGAVTAFADAARGLPGILAAVAAALGLIDFKKMSEEGLKAAGIIENLGRAMTALGGHGKEAGDSSKAAAEGLEALEKVVDATAFSLEKMAPKFAQFIAVAKGSGFSMEFATTAFKAVETAARATGAGFENSTSTLSVLERWMSQGTATVGLVTRALREMNISLGDIIPSMQGASRNTQLTGDALNKVLIYMNNLHQPAFTLQEDIKLIATQWERLSVAFGQGEMATETQSMQTLLNTIKEFSPELHTAEYALGALWGAFKSLGNYIEAGFIAAIGEIIRGFQTVWDIFSKILPAFSDVKDVLSDVGASLSWWGQLIGMVVGELAHDMIPILQSFALGLLAIKEGLTGFGEALGWIIGLIAGGLYKAFMDILPALQKFGDWIKGWVDYLFPAWKNSIDSVTKATNDAKAAIDAAKPSTDALTEATKKNTEANNENAKSEQVLAAEKVKRAAAEAAAAAAAAKNTFGTKDNPYIIPDIPEPAWMKNAWKEGQAGKYSTASQSRTRTEGITDKYGDPLGPSGLGQNQYSRPGGVYTGDDLIYGTGQYDTRPGNLKNNPTSPENQWQPTIDQTNPLSLLPGGQPMPVVITDPQGNVDTSRTTGYGQPQGQTINTNNPVSIQNQGAEAGRLADVFDRFRDTMQNVEDATQQRAQTEQAQFESQKTIEQSVIDAQKLSQEAMTAETQAVQDEALKQADAAAGLADLTQGLSDAGNKIADSTTGLDAALGGAAGAITGLGTDITQTLAPAVIENTIKTYDNTQAVVADTGALDANTGAVDNSSSNSGGGGGSTDNFTGATAPNQNNFTDQGTPADKYLDTGGIVGQWGGRWGPPVSMAAWAGAKHFAGGGITDGGQPIIAHPNEAIIPLQGGAVPVSLGRDIPQGLADNQETIINVGALAHEDALKIMAILNNINQSETNALIAFQTIGNQMTAAAASRASSSSSFSSSSSSSAGGLNPAQGGGGLVHRGAWGTSSVQQPDGTWKNEGYLPNNSNSVFSFGYGGQKTDALGKPIVMNGAADGLANTNTIPGMGIDGAPITVHKDEAIIPLPDGRSVPVTFPGGWGGQKPGVSPPGAGGGGWGGGTTVINHFHLPIKDTTTYGHGPTRDQIVQDLRAQLAKSFTTLGTVSRIDDPTVRLGAGPYNGGVRGTVIGQPQIL